ncbi:MAG: YicC family protein [Parvibaculaceae bacterium]|nr:YicC family protein [Parvibaculaceae bacterium]
MPLQSMTGFARADGHHEGYRWHWELRSVNGKGLDLRMRLPPGHEALEQKLRERVGGKLRRGNVQIALQAVNEKTSGGVRVNRDVLATVLSAARALRAEVDLQDSTAEGILALKGVLEAVEIEESEAEREAREQAIVLSFDGALAALVRSRLDEGAKLASILLQQIARIETLAREAEASPSLTVEARQARLKAQVDELLGASPALSPERLAQEAALLFVKGDIREEIDRLIAHVEQAKELIAGREPAGRRFDFLVQEFLREANTLCSKANDVALTRIGLELKTVIDQLREQVQNVE